MYSWHSESKEGEDDDLFSGFLTAINTFASAERGEDIKVLKLDPSTIIFERIQEYDLVFVITTKKEEFIELLHSFLHDLIDSFINLFHDILQKEFDGEVTKFEVLDKEVKDILYSYGIDTINSLINKVDEGGILKSIIFLEPKGGNILFIHAKQYVNREKISFLIPLIVNSSKLLYRNNLKENARWILLTSARNEILLVETRDSILIIKQYELLNSAEEEFLSLEFFKEKSKYIKKEKHIIQKFENIQWDPRIEQIFLVDLFGKVLYSKVINDRRDCSEYIPETISFLTSSKKASEEIYNRVLLNSTIGGESLSTLCINFNNFALILIGDIQNFSDFNIIQELNINIINQLY